MNSAKVNEHWIASVCSTDPNRPHLCKPFGILLDGIRYDAATDGRRLILIAGSEFPLAGDGVSIDAIREIFAIKIDGPEISIEALRAWCTPPPKESAPPPPCSECGGEGGHDCSLCAGSGECRCTRCDASHECGGCDGDGSIACRACHGRTNEPPIRTGRIGAVCLNMDLLHGLLGGLSGRARLKLGDPLDAVLFAGEGWRAALMPQIESQEDIPVFEGIG